MRATELALTGERLDGREAERLGLVNRAVPADELVEESMRLARRIAGNGPIAMKVTKQLIHRGLDEHSIATQVEREDAALARGFRTEDYREGARVWWIEDRDPVYRGK